MTSWYRLVFACAILASLTVLFADGPGALVVSLSLLAVVVVTTNRVAEPRELRFLMVAAVLALSSRELLAVGLELWLRAQGAVILSPDEGFYISAGTAYAQAWHGTTIDLSAYAGAGGIYPFVAGAVFWLFGVNVMVLKLINSAMAVLTALLVYRTMSNSAMPGARVAFVILLVFPSLLLWSVLALKDTAVAFLSGAVIWTISEFFRTKRYVWHVATVVALVALELMRQYVFIAVSIGWLAAVMSLPRVHRPRAAIAILSSVLALFVFLKPLSGFGENPFLTMITSREAVALTGRTSFVEPSPIVRGHVGDSFVVSIPGTTPEPGYVPVAHEIRPGTELVVAGSSRTPGPGVVIVGPGDSVTIVDSIPQTPFVSAAPTAQPQSAAPLVVQPQQRNVVATSSPTDNDKTTLGGSIAANVRQIPVGAWHVLAAPFPWSARTLADFLSIPEVLIWYGIVFSAIVGLLTLWRTRSLTYASGVVSLVLVFGELTLIEANDGTVVRHRAMLLPYAAVLAAVGVSHLANSRSMQRIRARYRRTAPIELAPAPGISNTSTSTAR